MDQSSERPISPDGNWEWDGQQWRPIERPLAAAVGPRPSVGQFVAGAVSLVVLGLCFGLVLGLIHPALRYITFGVTALALLLAVVAYTARAAAVSASGAAGVALGTIMGLPLAILRYRRRR